ncbi:MAG: hypothetical protein Q8R82_15115 [Hyphomonadaceae bacterium]|nr:hypothetical protein [Hyphomonadaceae bacterium]
MLRIKTEGAVCAVALQALRTTVSQAFDIIEQRGGAAEAGEDFPGRLGTTEDGRLQALCVDEGEACYLAGSLGDEQLHTVLDDDDVGFDASAGFGVGEEVGQLAGVFEAGDEPVDVFARDFAQPRDGVEREQDAQENEEQLGHGWEYDVSF